MQPSDPNYWNPGSEQQAPQTPPVVSAESPVLEPEDDGIIRWEASEHLEHNNGTWWYVGFFAVVAVLIGVAVLISLIAGKMPIQSITFIIVIIVMAVAALFYVRRPPRVLHYELDGEGLTIDGVLHPYGTYKSFNVIRDGSLYAILLMPTKRIATSTLVYFSEADGEDIVDAFGEYLPMEHHDLDIFDRFLRFIRF